MGLLRRARHDKLLKAAIPLSDDAAPFQGAHGLAGSSKFPRYLPMGFRQNRLKIHVDRGRQEKIVAPSFVEKRHTSPSACYHIDNGGKLLEIKLDKLGYVLRLRPSGRN